VGVAHRKLPMEGGVVRGLVAVTLREEMIHFTPNPTITDHRPLVAEELDTVEEEATLSQLRILNVHLTHRTRQALTNNMDRVVVTVLRVVDRPLHTTARMVAGERHRLEGHPIA